MIQVANFWWTLKADRRAVTVLEYSLVAATVVLGFAVLANTLADYVSALGAHI